jgi:hypothetical protein
MSDDRPKARAEGIHTETMDSDLLVFDEETGNAHSLNRTAAIVWRNCDGTRTVDDLVAVLSDELGEVADEDLVLVTLDDLRAGNLIEGTEERDREAARHSRRRFIRRVGTVGSAALVLPIVHSITAPEPAAAQSSTTTTTTTSSTTSSF